MKVDFKHLAIILKHHAVFFIDVAKLIFAFYCLF